LPHGLRHQRANDVYEAECGVPSPVRGGQQSARDARPNHASAGGQRM